MHSDLVQLLQLQQLETRREHAYRTIAERPDRLEAFDRRIEARREALATAKQYLTTCQEARRAVEKDLAAVQSRLKKFKDQLMEVKTNREYLAVQKEIASAEEETRSLEDVLLERLLEADELAAAARQTAEELTAEEQAVKQERQELEQELSAMEQVLARADDERSVIEERLEPEVVALFDHVLRTRRGIAVAEARGGHCTVCNVRLRPQVFNDVLRNDGIVQCESCGRILYFHFPPPSEPVPGA